MPWLLLLSFVLINVAKYGGSVLHLNGVITDLLLSSPIACLLAVLWLFIAAMGWGWSQHKATYRR
ncbi:hypothetical protein [Vibrio parahaemolyticus]|uniref:hypothetical protein n=1 Tax=Vibrio parahaemolyticus TaxID=670 RepID=UPI001C59B637|nr:hypothetical protein [Vibrio parahaemolyticus]